MPKQLWIPGGKGGGGHRETFYAVAEADAYGKKEYSRGYFDALRDMCAGSVEKLSDLYSDGYGVSRPQPKPTVVPVIPMKARPTLWGRLFP